MLEQIITFFKSFDLISIVCCVFVILLIILMIVKKQYGLFIDAIRKAEQYFNSGEGQKKLDFAVKYIQDKLPKILKPFISKKLIVSIIEHLLNKGLQHMGSEEKIDIKGNE